MSPKLAELIEKLREILQIDKPELDFGIYRVIRARAAQINRFLDESLPQKVRTVLAENAAAEKSAIETEIAAAEQAARDVGIDVDAAPKVLELRSRLAGLDSALADSESIVYAHLLAFFSRYYDAGDFISKRRYKGDVYAVPYAGEEVKLHWANADQYYTKTGENFTDYSFRLSDGARVNFKLVSAAVAKDNVKDADAVRCFTLWESEEAAAAAAEETEADDAESGDDVPASALPDKILEEKNGELFIYFQYKKFPKGTKQKELAKDAREKIAAELTRADLLTKFPLLAPAPTENDRERTVLDRELTRYVAKNTSDYFIHKDLKGFLTRELDFYVKNEMMQLDDIQNAATFRQIEGGLRRIQAVRAVALGISEKPLAQKEIRRAVRLLPHARPRSRGNARRGSRERRAEGGMGKARLPAAPGGRSRRRASPRRTQARLAHDRHQILPAELQGKTPRLNRRHRRAVRRRARPLRKFPGAQPPAGTLPRTNFGNSYRSAL